MNETMVRDDDQVGAPRGRGVRTGVLAAVAIITAAAAIFAISRGVASDNGGGAASGAATTAGGGAAGAGAPVAIQGFAFAPDTITVKRGAAVTWTNKDATTHSVKAGDGSFASQNLDQGQTFTATFSTPGTFAYVCGIHPFMTGKVVVQG